MTRAVRLLTLALAIVLVVFGTARSLDASPDLDASSLLAPPALDAEDTDDDDAHGVAWVPTGDPTHAPTVEAVAAPQLRAVAIGPTTRRAARAPPPR